MIDRVRNCYTSTAGKALGMVFAVIALVMGSSMAVADEDYADLWAPAVGTVLPMLDAPDHAGNRQTLASLAGENGLLLIISRSYNW